MAEFTISRIINQLPDDFRDLLETSLNEGVENMALLAERWADGTERFDGEGEALFAAAYGEEVIGLAAVSRQKGLDKKAMRMRRLYISPLARRQGVARKLADRCIQQGFRHADLLTCNARASEAAAPFWEAMGFRRANWPTITHIRYKDE